MTPGCEVVVTPAGTKAMRDRATGEVMHPSGARLESERLYLEPSRLAARLGSPDGRPLVLFDVGLGAGSNAVAAWKLSESLAGSARRLQILSFDRSLAALELALCPEHAAAFGFDAGAADAAQSLLERGHHVGRRTTWTLLSGEVPLLLDAQAPSPADVVFWDPFSPYANPELWTLTMFRTVHRLCRDGATLHTYSRATSTRSALLLAGFAVGDTDAIAGAKPGTVAALDLDALTHPLDRTWLERLERSRAPFPPDAPTHALEEIRASAQFQR